MPSILTALSKLGLTINGQFKVPEEGQTATNAIVETEERGKILLKFYPEREQKNKLETGNVHFEIQALRFFASHNCPVPSPFSFDNDIASLNENNTVIFAYPLLPGSCLKQSDLNPGVANRCGELLKNIISISERFNPVHSSLPKGDVHHILMTAEKLRALHTPLQQSKEYAKMLETIRETDAFTALEHTPQGIVHADFFFENVLHDQAKDEYGVIDFGDAYYGYLVMDIVIGAMEFSVLKDNSWNLDLFQSFLSPFEGWLKTHHIRFDLFLDLLRLNCLRFALYTIANRVHESHSLAKNPYVQRFFQLINDASLIQKLRLKYILD